VASAAVQYEVHTGRVPMDPAPIVSRLFVGEYPVAWTAPMNDIEPGTSYRTVRRMIHAPVPILEWWNSSSAAPSGLRVHTHRPAGGSHFYVHVPVGGCVHIEHAGNDLELSPGQFTVCTTQEPIVVDRAGEGRIRNVFVDAELLQLRVPDITSLLGKPLQAVGAAALLMRHLHVLSSVADDLDADELEATAVATGELLTAVLATRPERAAAPSSAALFHQADIYIRRWLTDPTLSIDRIAAAQCVSVRTLQRAFRDRGETVSGYLRRRRLEGSRANMIARPDLPVAVVCSNWGIVDVTHFPRQYRQMFGESPTDTRRNAVNAHR
jgi:AraC-like DNA-binding protein